MLAIYSYPSARACIEGQVELISVFLKRDVFLSRKIIWKFAEFLVQHKYLHIGLQGIKRLNAQ
jgi:transaldolase